MLVHYPSRVYFAAVARQLSPAMQATVQLGQEQRRLLSHARRESLMTWASLRANCQHVLDALQARMHVLDLHVDPRPMSLAEGTRLALPYRAAMYLLVTNLHIEVCGQCVLVGCAPSRGNVVAATMINLKAEGRSALCR